MYNDSPLTLKSMPSPPLVIEPIEIPPSVDPPIIDSESIGSEPIDLDSIEGLSEREMKVIVCLSELHLRSNISEFEVWEDHYRSELETMYHRYVDPSLKISYDDFAFAAFMCTSSEFNSKKLKYIRPLI
jgi:hypothetical protein